MKSDMCHGRKAVSIPRWIASDRSEIPARSDQGDCDIALLMRQRRKSCSMRFDLNEPERVQARSSGNRGANAAGTPRTGSWELIREAAA
jgi:hypothetical protein